MNTKNHPIMKNKTAIIQLFICACLLSTTAAFGQVTQFWTGGINGTNSGTDIGQSNNWGGILPNTANSDTGEWTGAVPGPLNLVYDTVTMASGFNQNGVNLHLDSGQTGSVTIGSDIAATPPGNIGPTIAIQNITIDSGAGAFTFGGRDGTHAMNWVGRPTGADHLMINNSANTATLTPWIVFTAGGGATWQLHFSGTGNWECDSYLVDNNGPTKSIQIDGPGTVTWNPVGFLGANNINTPLNINGGALVLINPHPRLNSGVAISLIGNFTFAPTNSTAAQTISGPISGSGTNTITAGTLTLSGQNTYSGDTVLAGGEVIVGSTETPGGSGPLGSGTITFTGGTLGFSVNNVFDYSARFRTDAGQAYNIDTAGQTVIFTNSTGLVGTGNTLTKFGAGSLTLNGPSAYTGLTTVNAGKLVFQGPMTGTGNITVADGAALGVTATNTPVAPTTLTVGSASGGTLEFDNVNSTTTAPLTPGTISAIGTVTINVNSGSLTPGQSYPLISWTSGSAPAVNLGVLNGFIGNLTTNGNSIKLNIVATAFKWTGINTANWDTTTANNWVQNGGPVIFANGGPALFDDTAITTNVTIAGIVQPTTVTVNNSGVAYTFATSPGNDLGGSASFTKVGNSTVAVSGGANAYTGPTTIGSGTLIAGVLTNGGLASDIGASGNNATNLVLDGGTLQYIGGAASSDRSFTVGLSGSTIDASGSDTLNLTAAALGYSGNGPRTLGLTGTGTSNVLAAVIANNGGATAVLKNGPGTWALTGNSTYTGLTTINNGVLQIGVGGANGTIGSGNVVNNGRMDFNRTGTVTVNGAISGTGSVTNDGTGTLVLAGNNGYSGGTYINNGTVQVGNGGSAGNLDGNSTIRDNGLLIFNTTGSVVLKQFASTITGTGNVWVRSTGVIEASAQNTYTGWTLIDSNATFQVSDGNSGQLLSSVVTNNGTLLLTRQDSFVFGYTNNIVGIGRVVKDNNNQNVGDISLVGTNTYTGGTVIRGGGIIMGDGINTNAGAFIGGIVFSNTGSGFVTTRFIAFNHPEDFTFSNSILSFATDGANATDRGELVKIGPNILTLTGSNSYPGNTIVGNGTLRVGNGGTAGNIGTGSLILTNGGVVVFNHSDNVIISAPVRDDVANTNGFGSLVQVGSGVLSLNASNTLTGSITVSNGTLAVASAAGGDLNVNGGTLAVGSLTTPAAITVASNLNITTAGTILFPLNKSLVQSNSIVTAGLGVHFTGGSLKLVNSGPSLTVGDKFTLFSQPIANGATVPIVSPGFTVANNLAADGSVTVTTIVLTTAPTLNKPIISGTNIVITATNNAGNNGSTYTLFATNNLTAPLATWPVIKAGSFDSNGNLAITNPIVGGTNSLFYILRVP